MATSNIVPDGGLIYYAALSGTTAVETNHITSAPRSVGLVFYIFSEDSGDFTITYIDARGVRRPLQTTTAYTGGTLTRVDFSYYVREAFVTFTPDVGTGSNLHVEAYSYGK